MLFKSLTTGLLLAFSCQAVAQDCVGAPSSGGGRKIGIAVDSSGSMATSDPNNLRIAAGKALVASLISTGASPDRVTVIDFDDSASVIYPLGDPANAGPSFDQIDSSGGTYIAGGLKLTINQLTSDSSATNGVTGVVVLTDGEDSSTGDLITQLNRAASLGIRVSFGFLNVDKLPMPQNVLDAILATGGVFSEFEDSQALQNFINTVVAHGLAATDGSSSGPTLLLPGLTTAGNVSAATSADFDYNSIAGEELQFTVKALNKQDLSVELVDSASSSTPISTTTTDSTGIAQFNYTSTGAKALEIIITTTDTNSTLFDINVISSANRTVGLCNPPGSTTNTSITTTITSAPSGGPTIPPKTNGTLSVSVPSTPTSSSHPVQYTSGAELIFDSALNKYVLPVAALVGAFGLGL